MRDSAAKGRQRRAFRIDMDILMVARQLRECVHQLLVDPQDGRAIAAPDQSLQRVRLAHIASRSSLPLSWSGATQVSTIYRNLDNLILLSDIYDIPQALSSCRSSGTAAHCIARSESNSPPSTVDA